MKLSRTHIFPFSFHGASEKFSWCGLQWHYALTSARTSGLFLNRSAEGFFESFTTGVSLECRDGSNADEKKLFLWAA